MLIFVRISYKLEYIGLMQLQCFWSRSKAANYVEWGQPRAGCQTVRNGDGQLLFA